MIFRKQSKRPKGLLFASTVAIVPLMLVGNSLSQPLRDLESKVIRGDSRVQSGAFFALSESQNVSSARLSHLPELNLFYRYSPDKYNLSEDLFDSNFWMTARLSQDLVGLFGVRPAKINLARANTELANLDLQQDKQAALFEFRNAYIDALLAREQARVCQLIVEQLDEEARVIELRFERKEALFTEVLSSDKERLRYRNMLQQAVETQSRLCQGIAHISQIEVQSLTLHELGEPPVLTLEDLLTWLELTESRRNEVEIGRKQAASNLVSYSGFHVTPFVGLRFRDDTHWIGKPASEFGLRVTIPLLQPFLGSRAKNSRRYKVLAEESENAHQLLAKKRRLEALFQVYNEFDARIGVAQKSVDLKKEMLRIRASKEEHQISNMRLEPERILTADYLQEGLDLYSLKLEKTRTYFEVLHLAGQTGPDELTTPRAAPALTTAVDAVWIWRAETFIRNDDNRLELVEFIRHNGFEDIFLSCKKKMLEDRQSLSGLRDLLLALRQCGTSVSALIGDPHWVMPGGREKLADRIQRLIAFNAEDPGAGFDAIHLDVEPQALEAWDRSDDKSVYLKGLVETVSAARESLERFGSNLYLEVDLPAFYGKMDPNICRNIVEFADTITLMAYACVDARKLLVRASDLVRVCVLQGKPFYIGLRASDFRSKDELLRLKRELMEQLATVKGFKGFALHDYEQGRRLN